MHLVVALGKLKMMVTRAATRVDTFEGNAPQQWRRDLTFDGEPLLDTPKT